MRKLFYFSNLLTLCLILSAVSVKAQTPVISTNPSNTTVCTGIVAKFVVAASDTPSYVWEKSADGLAWDTVVNGGAYANATTDTLSVSGSSAVNNMMYRAIAYKPTGAATSTPATLSVTAPSVVGSIIGASSICAGSVTTLSNTVAGGTWRSTNNTIASVVAGVVTSHIPGLDTIVYTVSNSCDSAVAYFALTVDSAVVHHAITGPTTVCVGSFINLANANIGGTWSVSNGNATVSTSGIVSGVVPGMDTITYNFANSCGTDVATAVVTVETAIAAGAISGPSVVCAGTLAMFSATTTGGAWFSNDATVATVDMSGTVTGRGQGTAIISYLFGNSCGSFVAMDTIHVERTASMITGSDSVGLFTNIFLADSVLGGVWTSTDSSIVTILSSGAIRGVSIGVASIVYTVTNSCGTSSATKVITVGVTGSAGTITGPDTLCAGTSITLTSSVAGGVWTASNPSATVSATGVVTGVTGGMSDTIRYTITNGFGSSFVTKSIYVNRIPVIAFPDTFATIVLGNHYTLHATPAGGTWVSTHPTRVQFISANTFVPILGGPTDLIYTVTNACGTSSDTFAINLPFGDGVATVAGNESAISIFPNPNSGSFTLNIAAATNEATHVVVTNMVGEVVSEMNAVTNSNSTITLAQPAGIYFVSATTSTGRYTARVVVAK